jgi:hypothetical protein
MELEMIAEELRAMLKRYAPVRLTVEEFTDGIEITARIGPRPDGRSWVWRQLFHRFDARAASAGVLALNFVRGLDDFMAQKEDGDGR